MRSARVSPSSWSAAYVARRSSDTKAGLPVDQNVATRVTSPSGRASSDRSTAERRAGSSTVRSELV